MNPISATIYCMTRFLKWDARGTRSEYWWFHLVYTLTVMVAGAVVIGPHIGPMMHLGFPDLASARSGTAFHSKVLAGEQLLAVWKAIEKPLMILIVVNAWGSLASLSATIRRLHDTGRSGWWYLISLVPFVGWLILLILVLLPSEDCKNEWGPAPNANPKIRMANERALEPYKEPLREIDRHQTPDAIRALRHSRMPST